MKRKVTAILLAAAFTMGVFTGCGNAKNEAKGSQSKAEEYQIGISQFAEHGSLDNCREGFLEGLKEEGIEEGKNLTVTYKNAAADMGTAGQIADTFVSDQADLICAIATPSAQTAYNAAMDMGIPVIYTAVTDTAAAQLTDEEGNPVGEVTGTSDQLPIEEQLKMIREMLPEAKTIGIMYTTSEANSISAIETYEKLAPEYGFTIEKAGITATADIPLAVESLLSKVDCMTNLTDNTVVNSLTTILEKATKKSIPVFGSEIEQVKLGCLAAEGLDYVELGKQTGRMAAKVLKGEAKASEMTAEVIEGSSLYINTEAAEALGIQIPESLNERAAEVFETISQ